MVAYMIKMIPQFLVSFGNIIDNLFDNVQRAIQNHKSFSKIQIYCTLIHDVLTS